MTKKKKIKFLIKSFISIAFALWIIFSTNWKEVFAYVIEIKPIYLTLYVLVLIVGFFISSYKWKQLANFKEIKLPFFEFLKLYFTGTFINNFMPSFVAGDAYKAYEIGKQGSKYSQAASTVMMDRITGLIGATFLAIFFTLLNYQLVISSKTLIITNAIVFLSFLLDIFAPHIRKISFLRRAALKFLPQRLIDFLKELAGYSRSAILYRSVLWGIVFSLVGVALLNYILFLALGVKINLLDYLSVIFLIAIISSIPVSINNIGIKEWGYITFFGIFGIDPAASITVAIISRFIQMIVSFFALPLYIKGKRKK